MVVSMEKEEGGGDLGGRFSSYVQGRYKIRTKILRKISNDNGYVLVGG